MDNLLDLHMFLSALYNFNIFDFSSCFILLRILALPMSYSISTKDEPTLPPSLFTSNLASTFITYMLQAALLSSIQVPLRPFFFPFHNVSYLTGNTRS